MASFLFYAGSGLDRTAALRRDAAWLEANLRAGDSQFFLLWRTQHVILPEPSPRALLLPGAEDRGLLARADDLVFLGQRGATAHFAIDLSGLAEEEVRRETGGDLRDLRFFGSLLSPEEAAMLAYARAILHWHRQHRFCGVCGHPTLSESAGHVRRCTACNVEHFPRTDPAVIMLVEHGDRCLLARQSRWPPGMVSTLAGFVEPGESLEEAVMREVREESGIIVSDVRYMGSQPWPFPCSIMLGFRATAASTEIRLDPEELAHAQWFTREEIARFKEIDFSRFEPPEPGNWMLPPRDSIARWLIDGWRAS